MTITFSFLPSLSMPALSSGLILISFRNSANFSLLVPIWSRYCWKVIPCRKRSRVTIALSFLCSSRVGLPDLPGSGAERGAASAHGGQIHAERGHLRLRVGAHHHGDPAARAEPLRGEDVEAPGDVAGCALGEGGALVLDERGLDRSLAGGEQAGR